MNTFLTVTYQSNTRAANIIMHVAFHSHIVFCMSLPDTQALGQALLIMSHVGPRTQWCLNHFVDLL